MAISCPTCGTSANVNADARRIGRLVRCARCGTSWVARSRGGDSRGGLRGANELDVSDAILIEDASPALSRPALPPPPVPSTGISRTMTLSAAGLALAVLVATGLLWPPIVAALPERSTANPGATGLQFRGVHSETIFVGQGLTLVVEGEIVNTRAESLSLPAVRIALKTVDGKDVTAWQMQPSSARLAGGQSIAFRSARASPPASATQVTLSLAY